MRTCVNKVLMCKLRTMRTMHIPRFMRESNYYLYHTLTNCVNNVSPFSNSVLGQFQFESKSDLRLEPAGTTFNSGQNERVSVKSLKYFNCKKTVLNSWTDFAMHCSTTPMRT